MSSVDVINEWFKLHKYGSPAIIYYESGQRGPSQQTLTKALNRLHKQGRVEHITRSVYRRMGKMEIRVV